MNHILLEMPIEKAEIFNKWDGSTPIKNLTSKAATTFCGRVLQADTHLGENVIMGQHVSFHAENHLFSSLELPIRMHGVTRVDITIDEDCWVGANVVFLDGCHVGRGCVVAVGAVVRGGNPGLLGHRRRSCQDSPLTPTGA